MAWPRTGLEPAIFPGEGIMGRRRRKLGARRVSAAIFFNQDMGIIAAGAVAMNRCDPGLFTCRPGLRFFRKNTGGVLRIAIVIRLFKTRYFMNFIGLQTADDFEQGAQ
ncbi:hypothetical protein D3C81_1785860 [compost metagenome]